MIRLYLYVADKEQDNMQICSFRKMVLESNEHLDYVHVLMRQNGNKMI